jgi:hypothetical protein
VVVEEDHVALGFPGEISGGVVDGGVLAANDTAPFWGSDDELFWGSDDELFWDQNCEELTYVMAYTPPADLVGETLGLELETSGTGLQVSVRTDDMSPFWGLDGELFWGGDDEPFWPLPAGWRAWPGAMTLEATRYEVRVRLASGQRRGLISKCRLFVDVADKRQAFEDVVVAAGGAWLDLDGPVRGIGSVQLTLQDDGGSAATSRVLSKDVQNGRVQVGTYAANGTATSGCVDADVQYY